MRAAIAARFTELVGENNAFLFSGWGGKLDEHELAVVESREPDYYKLRADLYGAFDRAGFNKPTDVWESQGDLMGISDQHTPPSGELPEINLTGAMYGALCLEEVGELCMGMAKAITHLKTKAGTVIDSHWLAFEFNAIGKRCLFTSKQIREDLGKMREQFGGDELRNTLPRDVACEVADAFTDTHVVAAGGSIAMALKGPECYRETSTSNLSKANPVTRVIDKDASGKWIKGANYKAPNLEAVLYGSDSEGGDAD
jgi:hypothetical protein